MTIEDKEEDNAQEEILKKWANIKFPCMTVEDAIAANMEYEAARKQKAHWQAEKEHQTRKAQDSENERVEVNITR